MVILSKIKMLSLLLIILILFISGCAQKEPEIYSISHTQPNTFHSEHTVVNYTQSKTSELTIVEFRIGGRCSARSDRQRYDILLSDGRFIQAFLSDSTQLQLDRPIESIYEQELSSWEKCTKKDKMITIVYK